MSRRRTLALLAALACAPAHAAAPVAGPVAVMPFRNLGAPDLDWLRAGMAETLATDLQRSGRVTVVERGQVDRALAEIRLQGNAGAEEETAARIGKLVGARTVVVGAFQQSGKSLRLSARFVAVETGVVEGGAKATGRLDDVFRLQDEVVERLLALAPGEGARVVRRPRRPPSTKLVQAFQLYSRALDTGSEADKVDYLQRALQIDPDFVYAAEDLAALQKRMAGYSKTYDTERTAEGRADLARAVDASAPKSERAHAAVEGLKALAAARRFHALAVESPKIASLSPEDAAWGQFLAASMLRKIDLALQLGEAYLRTFKTGPHWKRVEAQMQAFVDERKKRTDRRPEYEKDLSECTQSHGGKADPYQKVLLDWCPCIATIWNSLYGDEMIAGCSRFVALHANDPQPDAAGFVHNGRFFVVMALADEGHFEKARPLAEQLLADPKFDRAEELRTVMALWPTD